MLKQTRKGARMWAPGARPPGKMAPPRPPANLPLSWRDVRRPRRVAGAGPGPLPASLRYHGPPELPRGLAHRPPNRHVPRRYALGVSPNEAPNHTQYTYERNQQALAAAIMAAIVLAALSPAIARLIRRLF